MGADWRQSPGRVWADAGGNQHVCLPPLWMCMCVSVCLLVCVVCMHVRIFMDEITLLIYMHASTHLMIINQ